MPHSVQVTTIVQSVRDSFCEFQSALLRVIARLDSFPVDSAYILKAIGLPGRLGVSHTTQGNKTENTESSFFSTLDSNLLDQLYQIYKPDFLLFNYTVDRYRNYVSSAG